MKLSVITVNYNDREGLLKTVKSVVGQSFKDYEYIIIDGGSTDGSVEVLEKYADKITYWVSEPDKGIYNAMNKAIDVAKGEYCIFMNSGDSFCSSETLSNVFVLEPSEDIVCGNTCTIERIKEAPEEITFEYLFSNSICHQCAFIKTNLMSKYKYDEKYKIVSDRKFFLQALVINNCSYRKISINIVNYDINGYSAANPHVSRMEYDNVLEELIPLRIRVDYGKRLKGSLYGDTKYDKLFFEIGLRNYKKLVYSTTVLLLRIISIFRRSAKFVRKYPRLLQESSNK